MDKNIVQKLYIPYLEKMFSDKLRIIEEQGHISYIVFDGEREEFFLSFCYEGRIDLCWCNQMLIFDKGRNLLTSEDTFDEIVYENLLDLSNRELQAELILQICEALNGSIFISKQEMETGEKIPSGYDTKKKYIINISKENPECSEWIFGNIKIVCMQGLEG